MSRQKINPYPSEFKESSVQLALDSDQPISHTAKDLGINVNTLHTWISKYSKPSASSPSLKEHHFDEIKRLKKELSRVTQERDLLKKAAAYFAKETL
ncbi:hypothetical protein MNBD_ALPHA03-968 [hydrothermal vent metagenome]|uniref:Mobile element protein n=1 Tax=hydrothermal vent metagenome TaxID=652676 RepID=A0A3B1APA6_9ZZZZ